MPGEEWLTGFNKRYPKISIRTPEVTSFAQVTSFNLSNISKCFDLLKLVLNKYNISAHSALVEIKNATINLYEKKFNFKSP